MGWWETEHGVLGDEAADLAAGAVRAVGSADLGALVLGLDAALRAVPAELLADPERLAGATLRAEPEVGSSGARVDPEILRAAIEAIARVWIRDHARAPSIDEVLDAFSFVLRPETPLRRLSLSFVGRSLDEVIREAAESGYATTVDLKLDRAALERLLEVPNLDELDVAPDTLAEDAWPALGGARSLRTLRLSGTRPGGAPWEWLGRMRSLETLDLSYAAIDDRIVEPIRKLRGLRVLDVGDTGVTDAGFAALDLVMLEDFEANRTAVGDETALSLSLESPLRRAGFSRTGLTDVGLAALSKIAGLERLAIDETVVTSAGLGLLSSFPSLATLSLSAASFPPVALGALAKIPRLAVLVLRQASPAHVLALAGCSRLERLRLPNVEATPEMVEAVKMVPGLRVVDYE